MDQSAAARQEDNVTAAGEGSQPEPASNVPTESKTQQTAPVQQKQKAPGVDPDDDDDDDEESDLDDLDGKQPYTRTLYK